MKNSNVLMKKSIYFLINLIIVFCYWGCSDNSDSDIDKNILDPSKFYQEIDISYGSDNDQKFDLYLPANRTPSTKTVILVHGGGWSSGDKMDMNVLKDYLLQDLPNLAIININYRLADANNSPYPMQINDITSVIDYVKERNELYTISNSFGFIGISAGAHLSLLWSYAFDTDSNINMVSSIVGPTNFTDPAYLNNINPELQALLDLYGVNQTTSFLKEISPYHQITVSAPPTILFYAENDELVPVTQGTDLRDQLISLGITHEFTLYTGVGHSLGLIEYLDIRNKLKAFLESNL